MRENLEYNTEHESLVFKEYGRNIQRLVQHCITTEDRKKRNTFAKVIINLMGQLHPHLRNVDEFRHKLWDQLHVLADFQLDVDSPYPIPTEEELRPKVDALPYPQSKLRFKHYGKNVERLVASAIQMEDDAKKMAFAKVIANYMKMVCKNWNIDSASDETIKNDLRFLSDGKLDIKESHVLDTHKQQSSGRSGGKRKKVVKSGGKGGRHHHNKRKKRN